MPFLVASVVRLKGGHVGEGTRVPRNMTEERRCLLSTFLLHTYPKWSAELQVLLEVNIYTSRQACGWPDESLHMIWHDYC